METLRIQPRRRPKCANPALEAPKRSESSAGNAQVANIQCRTATAGHRRPPQATAAHRSPPQPTAAHRNPPLPTAAHRSPGCSSSWFPWLLRLVPPAGFPGGSLGRNGFRGAPGSSGHPLIPPVPIGSPKSPRSSGSPRLPPAAPAFTITHPLGHPPGHPTQGKACGYIRGKSFQISLGPACVDAATALLLEGVFCGCIRGKSLQTRLFTCQCRGCQCAAAWKACLANKSAGNRSKNVLGPANVEAATALLLEGVLCGCVRGKSFQIRPWACLYRGCHCAAARGNALRVHPREIVPNTSLGLLV